MPQHILVVEDDPDLRSLLRDVLEEEGYPVHTAVDGLDALQQLRQEPPALIVLDDRMPRLDGRGLVETLEVQKLRQQSPILILSGSPRSTSNPIRAEAQLEKPFDLSHLLNTVARLLEARPPLAS